jgi:hypothetical protein
VVFVFLNATLGSASLPLTQDGSRTSSEEFFYGEENTMSIVTAAYRGMLVTLAAGALLLSGQPVQAQKDPAPPPTLKNPPPAKGPLTGRPETAGA